MRRRGSPSTPDTMTTIPMFLLDIPPGPDPADTRLVWTIVGVGALVVIGALLWWMRRSRPGHAVDQPR